jgi:glyoxylase-like metal-dependent hydrolase (beta-lactamase superfamily II)
MQSRGSEYLQGLRVVLAAKADGTLPTRWISGENESLELGGLRIELKHRGSALTPGDRRVWPQQQCVLFSGDVVYTQRMSRVLPVGNTKHWLQTSAIIEALKPRVLVPGHGAPTDVATAKAGTQAYLFALREHMKQAVDEGQDVSPAVRSFDARLFMRLLNAAELMPGNTSRTYL